MTPIRRRLAIAVVPRLLGDALSRVLAREDRDVVVIDYEAETEGYQTASPQEPFDIALVSHEEPDLPASVVIRLPETPTLGVARVGDRSVPVGDLDSLVALIERCAAELDRASSGSNGA